MNFLYPAFLAGALAIAIPIALHLLRRDVAPDLPFTAVRLLKRSPIERSRRRRLRDILLLAARVTALILLALAFARPFAPERSSAMTPLRIVAIDRSFSMDAPGRFDRALSLAGAAIDEAAFGERVAVVAFDERAAVVAPPGSPADARAALASLRPGFGGTRYSSLLGKAGELASGGPARVIVVTDLQRAGAEGEPRLRVPAQLQVEVRPVDAAAANLAVTEARPHEGTIAVSVRNTAAAPRRGDILLRRDGRTEARAPFTVSPNATTTVPVQWAASAGGLVVSVEDAEGFAADNTRHLIVREGGAASVLVITSAGSPGVYLQRAIDAGAEDGVIPFGARLVTPAEIAGGRAQTIARHQAVVLLTTRSLDRQAREAIAAFVSGGGGLLIAAASEVEASVVAAMFGWTSSGFQVRPDARRASLTATDVRHPIFKPYGALAANLGQVQFTRSWRVSPDNWHVAARFDDGAPALLERSHGAGRVVLFASDLDRQWNDFPLHPAYVPFVVEAVRHVASRNAEPDAFTVGRVPEGIEPRPGLHRLASGRLVAVNVDPRESGTGVMTAAEFTSMVEPVAVAATDSSVLDEQVEARQSLWQYGLLLMLAALVVESFVGRS